MLGFHAIARVLSIINEHITFCSTPHYSTIRLWIYRLGLYELMKPLQQRGDWAWIQDEVIDIGAVRCLVIVGVPINNKKDDLILSHDDVQVIGITPTVGLTGEAVTNELKKCEKRTGKPLQIINDGAANLKKGTRDYINGGSTLQIQDITHKMALLLEKSFKSDKKWMDLLAGMSLSKRKVKQTELAGIMPPNLRDKARYMGADVIVKWGANIEYVVNNELQHNKIQKYFGWIKEFSTALENYREKIEISKIVKEVIRKEGYSQYSYKKIRKILSEMASNENRDLINKALTVVLEEVSKLKDNPIRVIGSSEVLESIFGKFKYISKNSNQGITANILSIGAFVGRKEQTDIQTALEMCSVKDLTKWLVNALGKTVCSVRSLFFGKRNKNCENNFEKVVA